MSRFMVCVYFSVPCADVLVNDFLQVNRLKQIETQFFNPLLTGWSSRYSLDVKGSEDHSMPS